MHIEHCCHLVDQRFTQHARDEPWLLLRLVRQITAPLVLPAPIRRLRLPHNLYQGRMDRCPLEPLHPGAHVPLLSALFFHLQGRNEVELALLGQNQRHRGGDKARALEHLKAPPIFPFLRS